MLTALSCGAAGDLRSESFFSSAVVGCSDGEVSLLVRAFLDFLGVRGVVACTTTQRELAIREAAVSTIAIFSNREVFDGGIFASRKLWNVDKYAWLRQKK